MLRTHVRPHAASLTAEGAPGRVEPWFKHAGWAAILAAVAAVGADAATIMLQDASFTETSVSAAAVGKYAWLVDGAIFLLAFSWAAIALAFHNWRLDTGRYAVGVISLAAAAPVIVLLAAWNGYDPDNVPDFGFHMMLVYALSALFPLAALTLARGLSKLSRLWGVFSIGLAALWILSGPVYALTPESLEGLFERIALALLLIWTCGIGVLLVRAQAGDQDSGIRSQAAPLRR